MARTTEELLKDAKDAIETGELDYSICLDGAKTVNSQKLVAELSAKLKGVNDIVSSLHVTSRVDYEEYAGAMMEIFDIMDQPTPPKKEKDHG